MVLPCGPLADPPLERRDLLGGQRLAVCGRWHQPFRVIIDEPAEKLALEITGIDDGQNSIAVVESQTSLAGACVRTVTLVAVVRENGQNVSLELDGISGDEQQCGEE